MLILKIKKHLKNNVNHSIKNTLVRFWQEHPQSSGNTYINKYPEKNNNNKKRFG